MQKSNPNHLDSVMRYQKVAGVDHLANSSGFDCVENFREMAWAARVANWDFQQTASGTANWDNPGTVHDCTRNGDNQDAAPDRTGCMQFREHPHTTVHCWWSFRRDLQPWLGQFCKYPRRRTRQHVSPCHCDDCSRSMVSRFDQTCSYPSREDGSKWELLSL